MSEPEPPAYSTPLDAGIAPFVEVLRAAGIDTFESCEGGPGHAYPQPTVRFHGGVGEGHRALGIAMTCGLPIAELKRVWTVEEHAPTGPHWELRFWKRAGGER